VKKEKTPKEILNENKQLKKELKIFQEDLLPCLQYLDKFSDPFELQRYIKKIAKKVKSTEIESKYTCYTRKSAYELLDIENDIDKKLFIKKFKQEDQRKLLDKVTSILTLSTINENLDNEVRNNTKNNINFLKENYTNHYLEIKKDVSKDLKNIVKKTASINTCIDAYRNKNKSTLEQLYLLTIAFIPISLSMIFIAPQAGQQYFLFLYGILGIPLMFLYAILSGFYQLTPSKEKSKKLLKELFNIEYNELNKLEYKNTIKE